MLQTRGDIGTYWLLFVLLQLKGNRYDVWLWYYSVWLCFCCEMLETRGDIGTYWLLFVLLQYIYGEEESSEDDMVRLFTPCVYRLIHHRNDWLLDLMIDFSHEWWLVLWLNGLVGWLIDWMNKLLIDWLVDWMAGCVGYWSVSWLMDWLVCWTVGSSEFIWIVEVNWPNNLSINLLILVIKVGNWFVD